MGQLFVSWLSMQLDLSPKWWPRLIRLCTRPFPVHAEQQDPDPHACPREVPIRIWWVGIRCMCVSVARIPSANSLR